MDDRQTDRGMTVHPVNPSGSAPLIFVTAELISNLAVAERSHDASSTTSTSDLSLRTNTFCSLLFSSSWSSMLRAVINIALLMRRRLCGKLHGGLSHLLLAGPIRHRSIASSQLYHHDLCLPHLTHDASSVSQ